MLQHNMLRTIKKTIYYPFKFYVIFIILLIKNDLTQNNQIIYTP